MAVLQGGGQNLPPPCVCYPKDPMWNRVNSAKLQILSNNFSKKCGYFNKKARTSLEADLCAKYFQQKNNGFVENIVVFGLFSVDKRYYIDMSMIKITIKSSQIDMDVCFFQK